MNQLMGTLSALPNDFGDILSKPMYVLAALLALFCVILLVKYLAVDLPNKRRAGETSDVASVDTDGASERLGADAAEKITAPVSDDLPSEDAVPMAASASDDLSVVAAITAAIRVYLEAENGGKALPGGFCVVSFKRRKSGQWNR